MKKTNNIAVWVDDDMLVWIKTEAEVNGRSVGNYIRELIKREQRAVERTDGDKPAINGSK